MPALFSERYYISFVLSTINIIHALTDTLRMGFLSSIFIETRKINAARSLKHYLDDYCPFWTIA